MSSSDSEDDCYGNIAQRLQNMKNKYQEDKMECSNLLNDSTEIDEILKKNKLIAKKVITEENNVNKKSDENLIDNIIASNTRVTRAAAKRGNTSQSGQTPSKSKKKKNQPAIESNETSNSVSQASITEANPSSSASQASITESSSSQASNSRGRGTPRGRRGRGARSRGRSRQRYWAHLSSYDSCGFIDRPRGHNPVIQNTIYPTYSIGNTDEYPDNCDEQELFSNKNKPDVVILDEADPLDDNEELSVKIYWQSSEFVKFNIRKYQKFTQIFEYFSKKHNVSYDKLLFTYNDVIISANDTPDTVNYNIAKFIDGGIVNQSVIIKDKEVDIKNGIRLKFQCQNIKKPFEIAVSLDEKMLTAMTKCAEQFERPLNKLKFEFDGDLISGSNTARDLELEGGECIDVKILS